MEAVLYVAYNAKVAPVSGATLAEAQNLPTRYLEPMMQKLVRAGILRGVRGPQGGYMLGRERRLITLADIYAVIAGNITLPAAETELGKSILSGAAERIVEDWHVRLQTISLAALCEKAEAKHIATQTANHSDFTI